MILVSQAQEEKGVVSLPIHVAMVEHTLRDVSLGIVLTSLSVEVVTDAIQFGKTLRLEFCISQISRLP